MTILDLLVVVIPGPLSWKLNQPLRVRIGVLGMFLLGLLICVCGALKIKFIIFFSTPMMSHGFPVQFGSFQLLSSMWESYVLLSRPYV